MLALSLYYVFATNACYCNFPCILVFSQKYLAEQRYYDIFDFSRVRLVFSLHINLSAHKRRALTKWLLAFMISNYYVRALTIFGIINGCCESGGLLYYTMIDYVGELVIV